MPTEERFGFLNQELSIDFDGGRIETLDGFENVFERFEGIPYRTELFYLPPEYKGIPRIGAFQPPMSHLLRLYAPGSRRQLRDSAASFVVYLLGYLYGFWLQLDGWWVDRPLPGRSTHNVDPWPDTTSDFISSCLDVWRLWKLRPQAAAINVLYMHARAPSYYQWSHEEFMMEYLTADACYRLARNTDAANVPELRHDQRLGALCDRYGIERNQEVLAAIARLRNDLFHEAIWAGRSVTGSAFQVFRWADEFPSLDPAHAPGLMRKLNVRLIAGVLGYGRPHTKRDWWEFSEGVFQRRDRQQQP